MRRVVLAVIGVGILAVLALFLLGQARGDSRCAQWTVRATPMDVTSVQTQEGGRPLVQKQLEPGWEPFAGSVRTEGERGKIGELVLRPYVFSRRCVAR
jgi:hypothetical protein